MATEQKYLALSLLSSWPYLRYIIFSTNMGGSRSTKTNENSLNASSFSTEWAALVIDEIRENELLQSTLDTDANELFLPIAMVKLPLGDISTIAVLS